MDLMTGLALTLHQLMHIHLRTAVEVEELVDVEDLHTRSER